MKINDVILQSVSKIVVIIILTLGFYLFFSGHNNPGGGFIGGLVFAAALVLLYLAFDIETIEKGIPIDFKYVAAFGAFLVVATGIGGVIFGEPFLKQSFLVLELPVLGALEFSSVTLFELGVACTVIGVVVTIMLTISKDVR